MGHIKLNTKFKFILLGASVLIQFGSVGAKTILHYKVDGVVRMPGGQGMQAFQIFNGVFCDTSVSMKTEEVHTRIDGTNRVQNYDGKSRVSNGVLNSEASFSGDVTVNPEKSSGAVKIDVVRSCVIRRGLGEVAIDGVTNYSRKSGANSTTRRASRAQEVQSTDDYQMPVTLSWTCMSNIQELAKLNSVDQSLPVRNCVANQGAFDAASGVMLNNGRMAQFKGLLVSYLNDARIDARIRFSRREEKVENYNCSQADLNSGRYRTIRIKTQFNAGAGEDDFVLRYRFVDGVTGGHQQLKKSSNSDLEFDVAYCGYGHQYQIEVNAVEEDLFLDDDYEPVTLKFSSRVGTIANGTMKRKVFWQWHSDKVGTANSLIEVEVLR